jgi:hypothetical protein
MKVDKVRLRRPLGRRLCRGRLCECEPAAKVLNAGLLFLNSLSPRRSSGIRVAHASLCCSHGLLTTIDDTAGAPRSALVARKVGPYCRVPPRPTQGSRPGLSIPVLRTLSRTARRISSLYTHSLELSSSYPASGTLYSHLASLFGLKPCIIK